MTRVGIITQARMTSSRLPGKVLLEAGGKTMLAHHLARLAVTGIPVIVATTSNETDNCIADAARGMGALVFRGSETDVLGRFAAAAGQFGLDAIVRVTSDCPLIDGRLIADGVETYLSYVKERDKVYVSNTLTRTYPRGFDFEVFSIDALRDADRAAEDSIAREHVTPYINQNRSGQMTLVSMQQEKDASRYRVTLDAAEDLVAIRILIEDFGAAELGADEITNVLEEHPEVSAINAGVVQKRLDQ